MSHPLYSEDVPADAVWYYLARQSSVPMPLARRAWRAISASPSGLALRYSFQHVLDVPPGSSVRQEVAKSSEVAKALREGAASPQNLFAILECCVEEKRLSRRDASQLENIFLRAVDRAGAWR